MDALEILLAMFFGAIFLALIAPWLIETLPNVLETIKNIGLWLIWLAFFRQSKD